MRRALLAAARHHRFHTHLLQQESQFSLQPSSSPSSACILCPSRAKAFCSVQKQATRSLSQHGAKVLNVDADADADADAGHYFDRPFWDSTYAGESFPLEWYQSYSELSPLMKKYIPMHSRVLVSGCGNSELSEDMVKDGYKEIVNIDISPVVIEAMKKKYHNVSQLKYMTMDVLDLSYFDNGSLDSVIDKGTLDAIMCVAGGPYNVAMMLAEIARVLKPKGVYMLVSFASPRVTLPLLNRDAFGWRIDSYILCKEGSIAGSQNPYSKPVLLDLDRVQADNPAFEGSDSLYIYMCTKQILLG